MHISRRLSDDNRTFLKGLLVLVLPIMGQEFLNTGVNLLDSFMIGGLGLASINGAGFANQIFFLFALVLFGVNSGSAIFMGQFWGKRDAGSIRKVMGICFTVNLSVATLFALCAFAIPQVLIGFYTQNTAALGEGVTYIRMAAVSYFFFAITSSINAALRSICQTRLPMTTTFISLLCNVVLNALFIFVFQWGVFGAALATVIARAVELTAQLILMRRLDVPILGPLKGYFCATKSFVKSYFKLTLPVILNESMWALGTTIYSVIYQLCGNEAQGAAQISSAIQSLFMVVGIATGAGCGIMLANMLGAGEHEQAVACSRKCLKLVVTFSAVMGVLLLIFAPLILSIYNVSPEVKQSAYYIMCVVALGLVLKTFNYTVIVGILRSGGDTRYCLALDFFGVWAVGIPLALFGAAVLHVPIHWVVALVYTEEIFKCILGAFRVRSNVWAKCVV